MSQESLATHRHQDNSMRFFKYRLTDRGVFTLSHNTWVKSMIPADQLIPINQPMEDIGDHKIEAFNPKTKQKIKFSSICQAEDKGFRRENILMCLRGIQQKHQGFEFKRLQS